MLGDVQRCHDEVNSNDRSCFAHPAAGVTGLIKTAWVGRFLSDGSWQPSPIFRFNVGAFGASTSGIMSNFVFAPDGAGGAWRIDDVYLDPTKHR